MKNTILVLLLALTASVLSASQRVAVYECFAITG
jgi:hypothetical protein